MAWFDWYAGRADTELQSLDAAGISYEIDARAKQAGLFRLELKYTPKSGGEPIDLIALYPELFPYFAPEIFAPSSRFKRHQNPNSANLCVLGRGTDKWSSTLTLGDILPDALETIIEYDRTDDEQFIKEREDAQGEPVSEYFNDKGLQGSVAVYDSSWVVPADIEEGWLDVEFHSFSPPEIVVRCVRRADRMEILRWDDYAADGAKLKQIPWVRFPGRLSGSIEELQAFVAGHPYQSLKPRQSSASSKHYFGILYEEEIRQFEFGPGWSIFQTGRHGVGSDPVRPIKTYRAGEEDLAARIPAVAALSGKSVAVIGLGAIGSCVGYELARNGIKELHVVDFDFVEPATVRRWISGWPSFGKLKTAAIQALVHREYPTTKVIEYDLKIGAISNPGTQYEQLKALLDSVDLVVDTSIEIGVNYLLSQMCWSVDIPYLIASASPGAWGGRVCQFNKQNGHACWICYNRDRESRTEHYSVATDPHGELQPPGCAAATFTGTSFDLAEISMEAVRTACGLLNPEQYPVRDEQIALCALRENEVSRRLPKWCSVDVLRQEGCACQPG